MTENSISILAMALSIIPVTLHGIEVLFPMQARWIVNWVLPLFGLKAPNPKTALSQDEQLTMLDAALNASPKDKLTNAKDYIFLLLFEQRLGVYRCFYLTTPFQSILTMKNIIITGSSNGFGSKA